MIYLRARNFCAAQTTGYPDFDAFGTKPHGILNYAAHGPTELNPTLQLLSNVLRHEHCVQLWLANFFDVDVHWHTHTLGQLFTQLVNVFAFLTDDDTRARRMNRDSGGLCRTSNLDTAD